MNYSEFRVMTTALERYYKDVKIAILTGKREAKDLDMRYVVRLAKSLQFYNNINPGSIM